MTIAGLAFLNEYMKPTASQNTQLMQNCQWLMVNQQQGGPSFLATRAFAETWSEGIPSVPIVSYIALSDPAYPWASLAVCPSVVGC